MSVLICGGVYCSGTGQSVGEQTGRPSHYRGVFQWRAQYLCHAIGLGTVSQVAITARQQLLDVKFQPHISDLVCLDQWRHVRNAFVALSSDL